MIRENKTLCEFPSLEWITIGGWLYPGCHGHPGSIKKQLFKKCKFYDIDKDIIFEKNYSESFKYFNKPNYIILEVEFIKYDNIVLKRKNFEIQNKENSKNW